MDSIINDVEDLKNAIISSDEYIKYTKLTNSLDNNKEINDIINTIKKLQQEVVALENRNENTLAKEKQLDELFNKLNNIEEYKEYLKASKKLNEIITKVQYNFSECFNEIIN